MRIRGFTLVEIVAAVTVVGVVAAAGAFGIVPLVERGRRDEQTREAVAQLRRMRAHALAANAGAAVKITALPKGVQFTTAVVVRAPGIGACDNIGVRASEIERHDYELLDVVVDGPSSSLCFEASAFRLTTDDGLHLADDPVNLDFFDDDATALGRLTVSPNGTFASTFEPDVEEGLTATVNATPVPPIDDPGRNVVSPRELEPELPVFATPPPSPTTPPGQPAVEALPTPTGEPPPPPPPACNVDADCAALFVCEPISKTCVPAGAGCTTDADCAQEESCDSGQCTYGCNTSLCPATPACAMQCQGLACCVQYGCLCL